jgi:hypothetical protein
MIEYAPSFDVFPTPINETQLYERLSAEATAFTTRYPDWYHNLRDHLEIGRDSYAYIPFVLVPWVDILKTGISLSNMDTSIIVAHKLCWYTVHADHPAMASLLGNDAEYTSLTRVPSDPNGPDIITMRLQIPSMKVDVLVDLMDIGV